MTNIYIDDVKYTVKDNLSIIEAAQSVGIYIPHFCWHPELSVSGNCRMCLVQTGMQGKNPDGTLAVDENGNPKINYGPKLQIACGTKITEGIRIKTKNDIVINAQEAIMEFLLVNHPLDCPICDEAGNCKLQEYAYNYSNGESRFFEEKNHKPKRVSWGDNVIYDAERCITCSRCIRFAKEVAKEPVLSFTNRGDKVFVHLETDKEFNNPYSMNVIDICPVGALTSKDFRFKARVWDMSFSDSICNSCSRGCNIKIGVRKNDILRLEPKQNDKVNKHWMCDYGRLNYQDINENRIKSPMINRNQGLEAAKWDDAINETVNLIKQYKNNEIYFIISPFQSNEALYLTNKFLHSSFKNSNYGYFEYLDESFADDLLKTNDKSPNQNGLKKLIADAEKINIEKLKEIIKNKNIKLLYIFDTQLHNISGIEKIFNNELNIISHCTNLTSIAQHSKIVLSSAYFAESEGTISNIDGIVQYYAPALINTENQRYMGFQMSRLDKFGAKEDRWMKNNVRDIRSDWRIIQLLANKFSAGFNYSNSENIFDEIAHHIPHFKNMSYAKLIKFSGLKIGDEISNLSEPAFYKTNFMKFTNS